jgi:hypothetical protein
VPHLDAGPFLSYGIQWITFGVVAPILLGYFVYAEVRVRRAEKAAARATVGEAREAGEAAESPAAPTALTKPAKPVTVEEKLADRYGRRR